MTDGIIKTAPATTDVAVYDPRKRDFFRGFGQHVGSCISSVGKLDIWIFGDMVEIHGPDGTRVKAEFSIKPLLAEAVKLMEGA